MSKTAKKAGDLAKAKGGKKPPAAKAAPANTNTSDEPKADLFDPELEQLAEEVKAPEAEADEAKAPEAEAEEAKAPEAEAEEVKAPEAEADEAKAPEGEADEAKAPEAEADEAKAPEADDDEANAETKRILAKREAKIAEAKAVIEIMDRCKADKLFRNPKGEYFTVLNYAMLSVNQDRKAIEQFDRRLLEAIIKKADA